MTEYAPLAITPLWAGISDEFIELIDLIPDDKLNWSPKPESWNFKGILLHVVFDQHFLMEQIVGDGKQGPDVLNEGQTKLGLKEMFRVTWERMQPFLSDAAALDREYEGTFGGQKRSVSGHELAFGQLEHAIHHRADIHHYLAALDIDPGEPDTLARFIKNR